MHVKGSAALPGRQLYKPGVLALLLALPALASAPGCATVRVYSPVPAGRAAPLPQTPPPTAGPPPQRAASLRLTEEGRKFIESGDYAKALGRLEKTISIDSTNPYGYYYLAQTHFRLGRHQDSLNFLDVAESLLGNEPFWLAEVFALKGENFRALGSLERADSSYAEALRLNSGNRVAADGLNS